MKPVRPVKVGGRIRVLVRYFSGLAVLSGTFSFQPLVAQADDGLEAGKRTFDIHCAVCHGDEGSGGAGPSLADDLTLHGGELADILRIIRNGVSGKPMNAWADKLPPETIARVAAYVLGLKGTRPTSANPNDRRSLM